MGLIPGLRRSPGGGNGNPLQYSCLENPMAREAWRASVHRVAYRQTGLKQLSILDKDQVHKKNNYTGSEWLFTALRLNLIFNVFNLPFFHIWGKILQVKDLSLIFSKIIWYFRQSSKLSNAAMTFLLFSHSDSFLTTVPSELFSPYINIYVNCGFGNCKSATFLSMEYQS